MAEFVGAREVKKCHLETKKQERIKNLRSRIFELLNANPSEASEELLDLLREYWEKKQTHFDTKMAQWKAQRIYDIHWKQPVLEFRIERHPGPWDRVQRWIYDFDSNEATRLSEWSPPQNSPYSKEQVNRDAKQIIGALLEDKSHSCIEKKGNDYKIWMGRLPHTKPKLYDLPQRTAKGRQSRLKTEVAKLMEMQEDFERVHEEERTGSLVYRRKVSL